MWLGKAINRQIFALISGMLLAIMLLVWWYVKPDGRINRAAAQVLSVAESLHRQYIGKPDYWGLNTDLVINNKALSKDLYKVKGKLVNALGKPVLIGSGADGDTIMPGEKSFDIVYTGLSLRECVALATHGYEQSKTLGLLQITIVSGDIRQSFGWGEANTLPISRPEAKKFCKNNSLIVWTME